MFYLRWTLLDNCFIIRKYNEFNHPDCAQININWDTNTTQWLLLSSQSILSWQIMLTGMGVRSELLGNTAISEALGSLALITAPKKTCGSLSMERSFVPKVYLSIFLFLPACWNANESTRSRLLPWRSSHKTCHSTNHRSSTSDQSTLFRNWPSNYRRLYLLRQDGHEAI